jgi:Cu/Ag efflux pump CusA
MIRGLVDFALNNRFMILAIAILLFVWGAISFHNLPVEAYPDVANNYVEVITQWPGRAAEEVEQQVTIPIEIAMAGIPPLTTGTVRRFSNGFRRSTFRQIYSRRSVATGARSARSTGTRCTVPIPSTTTWS